MRILKDPKDAALQQVLVEMQDSIVYLRHTAGNVDDPLVARTLSRLAARRENHLPVIIREVRKQADVLKAGDPDKRTAHKLLRRAQAILSLGDSQSSHLKQQISDEEELLKDLERQKRLNLSRESAELVSNLADHVNRSLNHLREVAIHLES